MNGRILKMKFSAQQLREGRDQFNALLEEYSGNDCWTCQTENKDMVRVIKEISKIPGIIAVGFNPYLPRGEIYTRFSIMTSEIVQFYNEDNTTIHSGYPIKMSICRTSWSPQLRVLFEPCGGEESLWEEEPYRLGVRDKGGPRSYLVTLNRPFQVTFLSISSLIQDDYDGHFMLTDLGTESEEEIYDISEIPF